MHVNVHYSKQHQLYNIAIDVLMSSGIACSIIFFLCTLKSYHYATKELLSRLVLCIYNPDYNISIMLVPCVCT